MSKIPTTAPPPNGRGSLTDSERGARELRWGAEPREPALTTFVAQSRDQLSDDDRMSYLAGALIDIAATTKQMDALPRPYRTVLLPCILSGEIGNGGVHQFFSNSSGELAGQVVVELRHIGLEAPARTIERGIGMFPTPYPVDTPVRAKHFAHASNAWDEQLQALTQEVDTQAIWAATLAFTRTEKILPQ